MNHISPRVIFIGDSGVGKTSLITRGTNDTFNEMTSPTIGAGVTQFTMSVNGADVSFQVWDTAGQEIYRSIVPLYFKYAKCAIVVFSFEDVKSFQSLNSWLDMLHSNTDHEVPVVIAGNKWDVEKKTVELAEAKKWANDRNCQLFFTSAKTGEQVNQLFQFVAENYVSETQKAASLSLVENKDKKKDCC